ncbi:hypothetical protein M758_UG102100 [Ceratodon purpureus]|nr:hypothetical protein M758_UG102100 [Ceratodon purpureus]
MTLSDAARATLRALLEFEAEHYKLLEGTSYREDGSGPLNKSTFWGPTGEEDFAHDSLFDALPKDIMDEHIWPRLMPGTGAVHDFQKCAFLRRVSKDWKAYVELKKEWVQGGTVWAQGDHRPILYFIFDSPDNCGKSVTSEEDYESNTESSE